MGNTPALPKKANEQRPLSTDLDLLPIKERFNQLAGPPAVGSSEHAGDGDDPAGETRERFVLLEDCSGLVGPRAVQVAARLYRVLDAGGDGKLDFEEFSSAACLLEGSPDDDKLTLLFKMYGDASKGGLVGREGLQAFILDILAASPPPFAPLEHVEHRHDGGTNGKGLDQAPAARARRDSVTGEASEGTDVPAPDFEAELEHVLSKMAGVVLAEHDGDGDGMLTEKEWRSYLRQEGESVNSFLKTLSDSVAKLLLP